MSTIHHMPDGTPAPAVLTAEETVRFLRLDLIDVKDPEDTLRYYRQRGLKAKRVGLAVRFLLSDVVAFVESMPSK